MIIIAFSSITVSSQKNLIAEKNLRFLSYVHFICSFPRKCTFGHFVGFLVDVHRHIN